MKDKYNPIDKEEEKLRNKYWEGFEDGKKNVIIHNLGLLNFQLRNLKNIQKEKQNVSKRTMKTPVNKKGVK